MIQYAIGYHTIQKKYLTRPLSYLESIDRLTNACSKHVRPRITPVQPGIKLETCRYDGNGMNLEMTHKINVHISE
tara:strand:- start:61 stop:285 length:225 start_codon:yes stop_codon:yes gene_type:complete